MSLNFNIKLNPRMSFNTKCNKDMRCVPQPDGTNKYYRDLVALDCNLKIEVEVTPMLIKEMKEFNNYIDLTTYSKLIITQ